MKTAILKYIADMYYNFVERSDGMDHRKNLISAFTELLSDRLDNTDMNTAVNALTIAIAEYDIQPKSTELMVINTESEMMLKKFLATKRLEGRSEKTIERYRYIIQRFYNTMGIPYKEVDVFALRLYLAQLEQNGCKDRTINGIRSIFSSFFSWLHDEGFIETNPSSNLSAIKCRKTIRKPYSNVELETIKNNCKTIRDRALIEFLLSTGCRINEATNLNRDDVNFTSQECKVLGKGNKERIVFMSDVCCMRLQEYLASRSDSEEALFLGRGNKRLLPGGVRAMLKRIETQTGVEDIHPHRFRRTLATSLIDRGMPIQDVAAILGHANINTTMTYIYTDARSVKATYKRLAS